MAEGGKKVCSTDRLGLYMVTPTKRLFNAVLFVNMNGMGSKEYFLITFNVNKSCGLIPHTPPHQFLLYMLLLFLTG